MSNKKGFELSFIAKLILALIVTFLILTFLGLKYYDELSGVMDVIRIW